MLSRLRKLENERKEKGKLMCLHTNLSYSWESKSIIPLRFLRLRFLRVPPSQSRLHSLAIVAPDPRLQDTITLTLIPEKETFLLPLAIRLAFFVSPYWDTRICRRLSILGQSNHAQISCRFLMIPVD